MTKTFAFAAAVLATLSTPAFAGDMPSARIKISDLDLTSNADQARLEHRVERAIRKACTRGGKGVAVMVAEQECRADLRDAADVEVRVAISAARKNRFAALTLDPGA